MNTIFNPINIVILSKAISEIGTSIRLIIWPLFAYILTQDPSIIVVVLIADQVGASIGSFISGYIADKFNRKFIIISNEVLCAFFTVSLGFLTKDYVYLAIPISVLWGMTDSIAINSFNLFIEEIKIKDISLRKQFAKVDIPIHIIAIITFFVGGIIAEQVSIKAIFIFDGITFLLCAFVFSSITYDNTNKLKETQFVSFKNKMVFFFEGYRYILSKNRSLLWICIIIVLFTIAQGLSFTTYIPYLQKELMANEFHVGLWRLSIRSGHLIAAIILQIKLIEKFHNVSVLRLSSVVVFITYFVMYFIVNLYGFIAVILVNFIGFGLLAQAIKAETIQQSPQKLKGRINAVRLATINIFFLLGHIFNYWIIKTPNTGRINFLIGSCIYVIVFLILIIKLKAHTIKPSEG